MMLAINAGRFDHREYFKLTRDLADLEKHLIVGCRYKYNQYSARVLTWFLTMKGVDLFEMKR
jgi:hypothetical protein